MANSTLDFSHPYFQKQIQKFQNDARFIEALENMKRLIEDNHEACVMVVQDGMGKYPACQGKIWKYDWAPVGARSRGRKGWRLVAIVPDPTVRPYRIIAGAVYPKNTTDQLSAKQLAAIFAQIMAPRQEGPAEPAESPFMRVYCGEGDVRLSVCTKCGIQTCKSESEDELSAAEELHECIE